MAYFKTERLVLRPLQLKDAERVEELAKDYDVAKTTLNIPHPYPAGGAKEYIQRVTEAEKNGEIVCLAITQKENETFLGIINIKEDVKHHRGELGYWIGKPYWGQGYCTEAVKALIPFSFEELKLNKLFATAFTANQGSWKVMEKSGLKYEGTLKQHVHRSGRYFDLAYYGLLREDYLKER